MRRVVVTGMGAVTPIGIGVENFWNSVKEKEPDLIRSPNLTPQVQGKPGGRDQRF